MKVISDCPNYIKHVHYCDEDCPLCHGELEVVTETSLCPYGYEHYDGEPCPSCADDDDGDRRYHAWKEE